jgi:hypothetical protein
MRLKKRKRDQEPDFRFRGKDKLDGRSTPPLRGYAQGER